MAKANKMPPSRKAPTVYNTNLQPILFKHLWNVLPNFVNSLRAQYNADLVLCFLPSAVVTVFLIQWMKRNAVWTLIV